MNLLGSAAYDPAAAVSKATSTLLALTALDTTNLRLAITVPAHGKVKFIMRGTITGAATVPGILFGVLNGATVLKRAAPQLFTGTQDRATQDTTAVAEFTVTGLAPGAMNVDAAYAVQVIVAATNIKYGGPNDTTGNDAWGAFVFEAWDPQPISGDAFARLGAPVGASTSADIAAVKVDTAAVKVQTDKLTFTVANQVDSNVLDWKSAVAPAMTGDAFARLGAPVGASTSADIAAVQADTDNIQTRIPAALTAGGNIKADALALGGTVQTGRDVGASVLLSAGSGAGQLDFTSGVVKANLAQILGTALTETAGQIAAAFKQFFNIASPTSTMNTITTVTTATTATNLTNAPTAGDFTAVMKTSLNAATPAVTVSDKTGFSLSTAGIKAIWDQLTSALTTAATVGKLLVDNVDAAISSRLATAGYTAPPTAAVVADAVWDEVLSGHLTASTTGNALNAAGAAGDPWTTALPGAYGAGTAGNIVGNRVDAAVSSRLASAGYTAPDNASITSIKSKTDNLPPDPADASDVAAAFTIVNNAIAGLNNISPAGVRAALGLAIANLDTQLAGPLAADVKKVNGVTVSGNGQTGTEWGPA